MNTTKLTASLIAASTLGGAAAGATLLAPGMAGALDDTTPAEESETVRPEFGERIADALQPLVDDGTLTDAEVDAVVDALEEARPEDGGRGQHGPGQRGPGQRGAGAIADILGLEGSEIRDALQGGSTIADLAAKQGVAIVDVVVVLVAQTEERVAAGLDSGRIDQEKADEILANAEQHAEDLVNGDFEPGKGRGGLPDVDADA
ncbi:MAG: hypothetical protein ACKVIY_13690 [Acidimicrobiales bacterium]